ncbi:hypothetical protein NP493_248g02015 [Ridgeia piscesae]|uniref:Uncharacterized protein n=1 Tax=Ridgeia piscesae TaxID=27915 RepID=A0AAD9NYU8_RIDPI|nr:hypothetical protein NP493_248g02015 [Ridgeia piscesae]
MLVIAAIVVCSSEAWWYAFLTSEGCAKDCKREWEKCLKKSESMPTPTEQYFEKHKCRGIVIYCVNHCS